MRLTQLWGHQRAQGGGVVRSPGRLDVGQGLDDLAPRLQQRSRSLHDGQQSLALPARRVVSACVRRVSGVDVNSGCRVLYAEGRRPRRRRRRRRPYAASSAAVVPPGGVRCGVEVHCHDASAPARNSLMEEAAVQQKVDDAQQQENVEDPELGA